MGGLPDVLEGLNITNCGYPALAGVCKLSLARGT